MTGTQRRCYVQDSGLKDAVYDPITSGLRLATRFVVGVTTESTNNEFFFFPWSLLQSPKVRKGRPVSAGVLIHLSGKFCIWLRRPRLVDSYARDLFSMGDDVADVFLPLCHYGDPEGHQVSAALEVRKMSLGQHLMSSTLLCPVRHLSVSRTKLTVWRTIAVRERRSRHCSSRVGFSLPLLTWDAEFWDASILVLFHLHLNTSQHQD